MSRWRDWVSDLDHWYQDNGAAINFVALALMIVLLGELL